MTGLMGLMYTPAAWALTKLLLLLLLLWLARTGC
jgi:hypothetical protein